MFGYIVLLQKLCLLFLVKLLLSFLDPFDVFGLIFILTVILV